MNKALRKAKAGRPAHLGPLLRHGEMRERFADVLTDSMRALALRLIGYRVEAAEFVASEHTPRNLMLRCVRTGSPGGDDLWRELDECQQAYGVWPKVFDLLHPIISAWRPRHL